MGWNEFEFLANLDAVAIYAGFSPGLAGTAVAREAVGAASVLAEEALVVVP